MAFLDLPVLLPQVKAGTLRAIAIGAPERAPMIPRAPELRRGSARVRMRGLRRCVHSREFKADEALFPDLRQALAFIKRL